MSVRKQLCILNIPKFPPLYVTLKSPSIGIYGFVFKDPQQLFRKSGNNSNGLQFIKPQQIFTEGSKSFFGFKWGPLYCVTLLSRMKPIKATDFATDKKIRVWTEQLIKEKSLTFPHKSFNNKTQFINHMINIKNQCKHTITSITSDELDIIMNRWGYNILSLLPSETIEKIDKQLLSTLTLAIIKLKHKSENKLLREGYHNNNILINRSGKQKACAEDINNAKKWREQYEAHVNGVSEEIKQDENEQEQEENEQIQSKQPKQTQSTETINKNKNKNNKKIAERKSQKGHCGPVKFNVKSHITDIHENKREYKCKYCPKAFNHKWDLKSHENIHTGNKPYKCKYCNECFANSSSNCKH
eukprot:500065_1